jgi:hypothetical protein
MLAPALALAAAVVLPGAVPHAEGERMEFHVDYLGIRMGKARLSVGRAEGPILPVFLESRSTGAAGIVALRQQLASYLDRETGLPRSTSLDAVEGDYRHVDTAQFDRAAGKVKVRERGKFDNTYLLDVPKETVDFVALVFRLRTLPLDPGARHGFDVISGRRVARVVAEVAGRETVETDAGRFPAVKVRVPTGFTGKFSEKNPTHIWFTDDARRIVVQITTDFAVGHAKATLAAYFPGAAAAAR